MMRLTQTFTVCVLLGLPSCGQANTDAIDQVEADGGATDAAGDADNSDADANIPTCVPPALPGVPAPPPEVIATEQLHADNIVATATGVTWFERTEWLYSQYQPTRKPNLVDWVDGVATVQSFFAGVGARLLARTRDFLIARVGFDVEIATIESGERLSLPGNGFHVYGAAVRGTEVFWTDDQGISRTPISGGMVERVYSGEAGHLAVDDDGYFFSAGIEDYYALYWLKTPLGQPIRLATLTVGTAMLTTSSSYVYQTVWPQPDMDRNGQITRIAKTGGDVEIVADNQGRPQRIVIDDEFAYWTTASTTYQSVEPHGTHAVMMVPHCGSTPIVVADNEPAPVDIAVDDNYIYWVNFGEHGDVRRVPKRWWK